MVKSNVESLVLNLLNGLDERKREVLTRRFGLQGQKRETLQSVGDRFEVTRERVRQVEALALAEVREKMKNGEIKQVVQHIRDYLENSGGVVREDSLVKQIEEDLGEGATLNNLAFIMEASKVFEYKSDNNEWYAFWFINKDKVKKAKQIVEKTAKELAKRKDDVLVKGIFDDIFNPIIVEAGVDKQAGMNYLFLSKKFCVNPYGDFGLAEWPEVNPTTIRDWSYLVLKKNNNPLHFEEIANKIADVHTKRRKVFTPTVHNELIKDPRFVLVGRGIYGLTEFGFSPGGIRELLKDILSKKGPMKANDIVQMVSSQRMFKKNTVMLHLQNRKIFKKGKDGSYYYG